MPNANAEELLRSMTLYELQKYVKTIGIERGFSDETTQDTFMLLVEELGEVAQAMRPMHGVKVANDYTVSDIALELADVQLLLLSLSNSLNVNLWEAIVAKEAKNRTRNWN